MLVVITFPGGKETVARGRKDERGLTGAPEKEKGEAVIR